MSGLLHGILSAPPAFAYLLVGLLVFAEAAVFVGFVLPGETAVVLGGVLAARHGIDLRVLIVLVVVAAIAGDTVGYEIGRHYGERVLATRPLRRHEQRLYQARGFLRERGAFAVFLGRWTAFLRAVMPGLAGVSRMPYRRFLAYNALGGVAWGITFCLIGYLAGNSYDAVEKRVGMWGGLASLLLVLAVIVIWQVRQRRTDRAPSGAPGADREAARGAGPVVRTPAVAEPAAAGASVTPAQQGAAGDPVAAAQPVAVADPVTAGDPVAVAQPAAVADPEPVDVADPVAAATPASADGEPGRVPGDQEIAGDARRHA